VEKKCSKCGAVDVPFSERKDRIEQSSSWCNPCCAKHRRDKYAEDLEYRERCKREQRENNLRLKLRVFEAYGGCYCTCCGEDDHNFLTLDHKKNNGGKRRTALSKSGAAYYRYLATNNFPDKEDYQVLCFNCNCARSHKINKGICPHQQRVDNLLNFNTEI
jgi:hypothetical protein